uniref:ATP-binding protein n=1 Tax=Euplotes harpa TaxID=151035 RepID=A0A7S3JIW3_9SPIT|mmetsp:Transcript_38635/g.44268  ORF Transcript_38635/g.44268 Transcript_38635/m.44268 type:complete len:141 (+) Transcript_38635:49-471(+)
MEEEPTLKYCFIMRGIPGSGKSTVAKRLKGTDGVVHSTDSYFINDEGEYVFDKQLLGRHHQLNYQAFCTSIDEGTECVIVDNINLTDKEYKKYQNYATKKGYIVSFVILPMIPASVAAERNTHSCPESEIAQIIKKWKKM